METKLYTETISIEAHAKVNLRLKVLGKRPDGYHLLSMLNAPLELSDSIRVTETEATGITLSVLPHVQIDQALNGSDNLCVRAAQLFFAHFNLKPAVVIELEKRIPIGSGLGGGSSNAAAILNFYTKKYARLLTHQQKLSVQQYLSQIRELALKLGADVPYFLEPCFAQVGGIGEDIRKLPFPFGKVPICLVQPDAPLSTGSVYANYNYLHESGSNQDQELERFGSQLKDFDASGSSSAGEIRELYAQFLNLLTNDLVKSACQLCDPLAQCYKAAQSQGFAKVSMTGSGSALFLLPKQLEFQEKEFFENVHQHFKAFPCKLIPTFLANL